ncbi:hypothetical protein ABZV77_14555 [Streptomyces sp. NPDC004732]|uniref:hypothetical protein n=1 Tax=Streptomyces sp. NPDC004732 TaxID=3154290 RepID=UPI0033B111A0
MHQNRRRDRRPARRVGPWRARPVAPVSVTVEGADIVLVGYFSGKQKDVAALMNAAEQQLTSRGARVVGRIVQRRGVSDGGAEAMGRPYSSRTLLTYGKVREAAALCERSGAEAAVFLTARTPLTTRQSRTLTTMLGCPAVSFAEILTLTDA